MGTSKGCEEKRREVVKEREGVVRETLTKRKEQTQRRAACSLEKYMMAGEAAPCSSASPRRDPTPARVPPIPPQKSREDGAQQTHKQAHNKHTKHERDMMKKRRETKRE